MIDDVDIRFRIHASHHGPEDFLDIRRIDVFVHHDDESSQIGAAVALGGDVASLAGMAGVTLLDRYGQEQARAANFVGPHALHVGHPSLLDVVVEEGGTQERTIAGLLVRRLVRRRPEHDRVIAVIDGLDVEHRLVAPTGGVVPGPFAERAFREAFGRARESFEHDLGIGRKRQTGYGTADDLHGLAADPANPVVLTERVRDFSARGEKHQWMRADDHRNRAWLAAVEVLLPLDPAVFAG